MIELMSSISDVVAQLRELPSTSARGIAFEKLMVNYFRVDPVLSQEFDEVVRWGDWRYNGQFPDTGIDLVARRSEDQTWTAIQCKFYDPSYTLSKDKLDSFFEMSGRTFDTERGTESFASRLVISTTDRWSSHAEEMLDTQTIPTNRIGLASIAESPINWDVAFPGSEIAIDLTPRETFSPRPHQREAINKVLTGFQEHNRGKLVMACGTGKTFTALRLAEEFATANGNHARVLFLVPSISLLSQTLREWTAQANPDLRSIAVCSDTKVSKQAEDIAAYDLEVPVTTDGATLAARLAKRKRAAGLTVVFSTYQSIQAVHEAQARGADAFDLIIADEAHHTTGVTLAGDDPSNFTRVHDADYVRASKRLYMTATPRLYDDTAKAKAEEHSAEVASMDDEAVYGPEFHRLGFGEAVDRGLLTDYRVVVLGVSQGEAARALESMAGPGEDVALDLASAMIGAWNALAKRSGAEQDTRAGFASDERPMRSIVAFAKDIKTSKAITEAFPRVVGAFTHQLRERAATSDVSLHHIDQKVAANHVDGSMNALRRNNLLTWRKAPAPEDETRVLTNARCLSEGVDVPALDGIIFFNPRESMVDVVQSVGRVMRRSRDKNYGYIILPVAIPEGASPSAALGDNKRFRVVWQILNALRAHDDRFNAMVNSVALNAADRKEANAPADPQADALRDKLRFDYVGETPDDPSSGDRPDRTEQMALFSLEQWQEALYTRLVDKVGTRTYWEDWADDVADIAEAQITRIKALLDDASPALQREFKRFLEGLRGNLNDSITADEAISMLSQHLITAPVFDALFAGHDFAHRNPVAQVMETMVAALSDRRLESETESLERFYDSVRVRASEVTSASGKQTVIKELYERFFRKAFRRQAEALGIVYTPVEIVDFILRAADEVSRKHFGKGLSDAGVHVLDPFTGTGTFMVRLLQSGLISPEDLARKYASELHATEIMLLAYYVAAVNIETTYHALVAERAQREGAEEPGYEPFEGIALADTFQITEDDDALDLEVFRENNARIDRQMAAPIHVIVGNPPYSVGQRSANDNNANLKYPTLDRRIEESYAAKSTATNKNSLYDSYLRAFRWATDRIGDRRVVAFVSNGGWVEGNSGDGVRLSMAEDFSVIYVFNLRGNARTAGEQRRKEAGNIFRDGGRTTIAITIGIKDPAATGTRIHYRDIGDYLSAEEKLGIVERSSIANVEWQEIIPNAYGDWVSQRSEDFETLPVLGAKKIEGAGIFGNFSAGLQTNRDSWVYSYSKIALQSQVQRLGMNYTEALSEIRREAGNQAVIDAAKVVDVLKSRPDLADPSFVKWSRSLRTSASRGVAFEFDRSKIVKSTYRPFSAQWVYFDKLLNHERSQTPSMFPTRDHANIGFEVMAPRDAANFALLATNYIPDLSFFTYTAQFFPRFTWEPVGTPEGELDLGGTRASISLKKTVSTGASERSSRVTGGWTTSPRKSSARIVRRSVETSPGTTSSTTSTAFCTTRRTGTSTRRI